jgi:ABC-type Fe3+-hydroxamate transport system substrate-binding protein
MPRRRALMVLQREPVFVVGSGGFIDELLGVAGAENLGASFGEPYPQVAVEWLIDAGPEVLIDMSDEPGDPLDYWSRWPAIPAVAAGRVLHLEPARVTLPGPWLDGAIEALVGALHGRETAQALRAALASQGEPAPGSGSSG